MKKKGKLTKGAIAAIVSISVATVIFCTLFVVNLFFPLKYLTAYMVASEPSPSDGIYCHFLDVGQADCTIVELPDGKTMLIDGGDGAYTNTLKILKKLNSLGIDTIDYAICTSVNEEHCGGLADIIAMKSVSKIYCPYCTNIYLNDSYYNFYTAAVESGAEIAIAEYGAGGEGGSGETDYFFTFLSPVAHGSPQSEYTLMNADPTDENIDNASAILWIECNGRGIFYAGDAQTSVLQTIADSYSFIDGNGLGNYFTYGSHIVDFSKCVLYKVANHGSYNSICTSLLELLSPEISVISVGENNASDCPSVYVMADLNIYGSIYLTSYSGDITIKTDSLSAAIIK